VLDEPDGFELAEMLFDGVAILFGPPRELCARGWAATANQVEKGQPQRVGERA
jgi:hypothetical protein